MSMKWSMRAMPSGLYIILALGTSDIEAARLHAAQAATRGRLVIVTGIVRSPLKRCWYMGLSRWGAPVQWVSAHRWKRDAEQQVRVVFAADRDGDLRVDSTWEALVRELATHSATDLGRLLFELPAASASLHAHCYTSVPEPPATTLRPAPPPTASMTTPLTPASEV